MASFSSGTQHDILSSLHRQFTNDRISRQEFVEQIQHLGYEITPALYRHLNQPNLRYSVLVTSLRKTQTIQGRSVAAVRGRSYLPTCERLENTLFHSSPDLSDKYHGGQELYQGNGTINDILQENGRRGTYFSAVQNQVEGGAASAVFQRFRKLLVARGTLEEASVFLMGAPAVHGLNIQLMARKMKSFGVFLERGELKTLELCFPAKGLLDNHVDGQAIGQMLSNTTINAPDKGKSHEYRYVPSSNTNSYGNNRPSYAAEHEDSPSEMSSLMSSLTNGTANHVPGHMSSVKSFSQVQDEYILERMLKNLSKSGTVVVLRRLRDALNMHGNNETNPSSAQQEPKTYSAEIRGRMNFYNFMSIFRQFIPSIPESDLMAVFDNLYPDEHNRVSCSTFYHRMRGALSKKYVDAIESVFQGLLGKCSGGQNFSEEVSLNVIFENYSPVHDPEVINGHTDVQTKTSALLEMHQFVTHSSSGVSRQAFFDFFSDLGACKPNEQHFVDLMRLPWYKVLTTSTSKTPLHNHYAESGARPIGFHTATRDYHAEKSVPTKVLRVLRRLFRDASWSESALKALYQRFDTDNDGVITATEFCRFFADLKIRITADEMDQVLNVLDTNNDGVISFEEFMAVVHESNFMEKTQGYMGISANPHVVPQKKNTRIDISQDQLGTINYELDTIRKQLNSDDEFGFRNYGKLLVAFYQVTRNVSPWMTQYQFVTVLQNSGILFSDHHMYQIFNVFQAEHSYQDMIHFWQFLDSVSHKWNDARKRITQKAFNALDQDSNGLITKDEMAIGFQARQHPSVRYKGADSKTLKDAFYVLLESVGSGAAPINKKQWNRLMRHTMSACEESDAAYEEMMRAVWNF